MSMSVSEAGRIGGMTVLQKHGKTFYAQIGKKGQMIMRRKYPNNASQWGKMGGRPRKLSLSETGGDKQK